jgi:hypothetical protein
MAQSDIGIRSVTPNAKLVQMAMTYSRSCMLYAAARLGGADALGIEVRSVDDLAGVFAWPQFFRWGMMWGSSTQSQLGCD